jgi:ribonucleoside-diphosphate reductase alpha chain
MDAVENDGPWQTRLRTTGAVYETFQARKLWHDIAEAAWVCADPGVQYDDTIQKWHTCKATDRINATNPCVTGDTLVATSEGWRRIDELVGKNPLVFGSDGALHRASAVFPTGRKQVYRLRTESGFELRLTADHRVMVANGRDVAAIDLRLGVDRIRLSGSGFNRPRCRSTERSGRELPGWGRERRAAR